MTVTVRRKSVALLVLQALLDSRNPRAMSARNLTEYVAVSNNVPEAQVRRTVHSILKQGVDFRIIRKKRNGLYKLNDITRRRDRHSSSHRRRRSPVREP